MATITETMRFVQKVSPKEDEVLIFYVQDLPTSHRKVLTKHLKEIFPDNKFLVLDQDKIVFRGAFPEDAAFVEGV